MFDFVEELWDEVTDFFEDFFEHAFQKQPKHPDKTRETTINGALVRVRPAYLFADRIDHTLKLLFGASILISAFTATFVGFASLSDLVDTLINTIPGRIFMFFIGSSYLILGIWKLMHLGESKK